MPNPQQPELARSRKSDAVTDDAVPTKAKKRSKKGATIDAVGPIPEDNLPGHQPEVIPDKPMVPPDPYRMHPAGDEVRGPTVGTDRDDVQSESSVTFDFLFDRLFLPFAAPLGVLPQTTSLVLDDGELFVRFGPWTLRTPRENIAGCEVTGPYQLLKVAGGPHLSLKDRGVTFATNRRSGACIRFHEPVTGLLPWGLVRHPAATVTISNPHDLARRLNGDGG